MPRPKAEREDFNEDIGQQPAKVTRRIVLPLNDEGGVDWVAIRPKTRDKFINLVSKDPMALEAIGLKTAEVTQEENALAVTESHVKYFLEGYATIERLIIPKLIAQRTKGQVVLSSAIVDTCFNFTDEQKNELAPSGAQWANEALPESIRKFLLQIGPGAKFFGLLGLISYNQMRTALILYHNETQKTTAPNGANGHAEEIPLTVGE